MSGSHTAQWCPCRPQQHPYSTHHGLVSRQQTTLKDPPPAQRTNLQPLTLLSNATHGNKARCLPEQPFVPTENASALHSALHGRQQRRRSCQPGHPPELGCETSTDDVVTSGHHLHQLTTDIRMGLVSSQVDCLKGLQPHLQDTADPAKATRHCKAGSRSGLLLLLLLLDSTESREHCSVLPAASLAAGNHQTLSPRPAQLITIAALASNQDCTAGTGIHKHPSVGCDSPLPSPQQLCITIPRGRGTTVSSPG
jgi:hypothetical protein